MLRWSRRSTGQQRRRSALYRHGEAGSRSNTLLACLLLHLDETLGKCARWLPSTWCAANPVAAAAAVCMSQRAVGQLTLQVKYLAGENQR